MLLCVQPPDLIDPSQSPVQLLCITRAASARPPGSAARGPKVCRRAWRPYGARRCGGLILRAKRWRCGLYGSGSAGADGGPAGAEAAPGRRHAGPAGRRGVGAAACRLVRTVMRVRRCGGPCGRGGRCGSGLRVLGGPCGGCETDAVWEARKDLVARGTRWPEAVACVQYLVVQEVWG